MILGTYCPSGDRCLSVVSYCWWSTKTTSPYEETSQVQRIHLRNDGSASDHRTHHQIEGDKIFISHSLDLHVFIKGLLEGCEGRKRGSRTWSLQEFSCWGGLTLAVAALVQMEDDHQGLVTETHTPLVTQIHQLRIMTVSLCDILGPGPVQSLFVGLSPDQLISPPWTRTKIRVIIVVTFQSRV